MVGNIDPRLPMFYLLATLFFVGLGYYVLRDKEDESAVPFAVPVPGQCDPAWKGTILEEPQLKAAGSSAIQCYCPANGNLLGVFNAASPAAIDRAVAKATEAQPQWAKTSFKQRRRVLRTLLKNIIDNQETIARAACLDTGKTKVDASFGEILTTAARLEWTIKHGEKALKAERRTTNLLLAYKVNEVRWEPLGVVAACVSWNYPLHNLLGPIITAIFAGNAIIVKCSESTAWSSQYFISIIRQALSSLGHSPAIVQSIVCWPSAAPHLTSHPGISQITFIGSRPVAHHVLASASKSLTPVCVELGGKDAAIVLNDADLNQATSILMRGVFQNAGQNCIGIERIIACPNVYDPLLKSLEARIKALRLGSALDDGTIDVGAMISAQNFDRLEHLITDAVNHGARLLAGGKRFLHPKHPKGHYFSPTLLADVTPSMAIAQHETFAPICLLMRATDVDDALRIANSTEYGLGASVFGRSARDMEKVVAGLKTGMVSVNDFGTYYLAQLPFGGVGGSGYGRFGGVEGLRGVCSTKAVCRDRFPALVRTAIPAGLDYPLQSAGRAWGLCVGIVEVGFGVGWRQRVRGVWRMVRGGGAD